MAADRLVLRHILVGDRGSFRISDALAFGGRRVAQPGQHPLDRPAQIDRGRPRLRQHRRVALQRHRRRILPQAETQPVRRRGPDQRRAAHLHGTDGMRRLRHVGQPHDLQRPRQLGLVDDADRPAVVRIDPDGSVWHSVDTHEPQTLWYSTQTSVNNRRAVAKSMAILPSSRARISVAPSSCSPRRPMSIAWMRSA